MVENHPGRSSGGIGDGELGFHLLAARMSGKMGERQGYEGEVESMRNAGQALCCRNIGMLRIQGYNYRGTID
jgi:hypothetical protein